MIELPNPTTYTLTGDSHIPVYLETHLYTADQLRTYGDQRAAEAREQMRGELKTVKKHALNGVDLPCIECGIVGCNGECSGDGAMGD